MNRHIRLYDVNSAQIGHFEEIGPDNWRGVDHERSRGICIYFWEMLITRIADLIGSGDVYRMDGSIKPPFVEIDRSHNIWLDHTYMAPDRYLPLLIPKTAP